MTASIRRIAPGDGDELRRVRLAALRDDPSAFGSTLERELAFTDDEWAARAAVSSSGEDRATFLAHRGGGCVGIVGAFRVDTTVDLVSMWTAPEARRLGLARRLVAAVVTWADQTSAERVELWVTRGNDAALRLYEDVGFHVTGDHQPLPSDPCRDEIRMRRRL